MIFILMILMSFPVHAANKSAFVYSFGDSKIKINSIKNDKGLVTTYFANVNIPVCQDQLCKEVRIKLYWNVIGQFVRFELIPGYELSKEDHILFTEKDYLMLDSILKNPGHILGQIVNENKNANNSAIDIISGATIKVLDGEVVPGALYTCQQLWLLTNGMLVFEIQRETRRIMNSQLIEAIADLRSLKAYSFLIRNLSEVQLKRCLPLLIPVFSYEKSFLGKKLIQKLPERMFKRFENQKRIGDHYLLMDYYTQISFLQKLKGKQIAASLQKMLMENLENKTNRKNKLILGLLEQ